MLLYLLYEGWVELHAGEFLPGDVYRFGRMADETVFDRGSNVDQYRGGVFLQQGPGLFGVEIVYHGVESKFGILSDEGRFVAWSAPQVAGAGVFPVIYGR